MSRARRRYGVVGSGTGLLFCSFLLTGCIRYHTKPLNPVLYQTDFLRRSLQDPGLADFVRANGASSVAWPPTSLTLADANLIAAYYNPDVAVARTQLEAAKAALITAGGLPNPEVTGGAGYETVPHYPVAIHFDLGLTIETAGKRHYRILAAQEQLGAAGVALQEAEWNTYTKVRNAWFDYAAARQLAVAYHAEVVERARAVSLLEQRLEVGQVSEPVVSQARIVTSEAALASAAAEGRRETAEADLAAALGLTREAIQRTVSVHKFPFLRCAQLYRVSPEIGQLAHLGKEFFRIVRSRDFAAWPEWLEAARHTALSRFVSGLTRDREAVEAALEQWPSRGTSPSAQADQTADVWPRELRSAQAASTAKSLKAGALPSSPPHQRASPNV